MNKSELVYKIVKDIPKGKVLTYGALAKMSGIKNPRQVGTILHKNTNPDTIPCHRIVNFQGKTAKNYAFGRKDTQIKKLKLEGIKFRNDKINLDLYLWHPDNII